MTYRESASTRPNRTAAIGRHAPASPSHPLDSLIASSLPSPAEQSALIKTKRGIPLTPHDQAAMRAVIDRLAGLVGDRPPVARPTSSVSASDYRESRRELELLKKRHQAPPQTVNGQVVRPLATLKTPPPARIYVPSSHR